MKENLQEDGKEMLKNNGIATVLGQAYPDCTRRKEGSRRNVSKEKMKWMYCSTCLSTSARFRNHGGVSNKYIDNMATKNEPIINFREKERLYTLCGLIVSNIYIVIMMYIHIKSKFINT